MNKITSYSKKIHHFLETKWSIFVFIGGILLFGLINIILFSLDIISIKVPWINSGKISMSSSLAWLGWMQIVLSIWASIFNIYGLILISRKDKNFIFPIAISFPFLMFEQMVVGAIFSAFSTLLLFGVEVIAYFSWVKEPKDGDDNQMTKNRWILFLIGGLLFILIGGLFYWFVPIWKWDSNKVYISVNDVLGSAFVLVFWSAVMFKDRKGYLGLLIANIMYIFFYFWTGTYSAGIHNVIYLLLDSVAFISWFDISKERESSI